jgi:hypothetical protein
MSKIVQNSQPATLEELLTGEAHEVPVAPVLRSWQDPEEPLLDVHPYTAAALVTVTLATIVVALCFLSPLPAAGAWSQVIGRISAALAAFFLTAFIGELVASHTARADAELLIQDEIDEPLSLPETPTAPLAQESDRP